MTILTPETLSLLTDTLGIPTPSYNEFNVPVAFLRNCGTWKGLLNGWI